MTVLLCLIFVLNLLASCFLTADVLIFFPFDPGFNAAVAGCFFAIETVLRPLRAENSPPFTTAMIILASVISSTVSNVVLGETQAFTVPKYDLKSAAGILSNSCSIYCTLRSENLSVCVHLCLLLVILL